MKTLASLALATSRQAGGAFRLIGGAVTGRNIELIPNTRVVQAWRIEAWPAGLYSIVKFELIPNGSGTRVVFDQTGFPRSDWQALSANWPRKYWDPLRDSMPSCSAAEAPSAHRWPGLSRPGG